MAERFLETVSNLGVKDDGGGLDYFIPPKDEVPLHDIPTSHQFGYVALTVGASRFNKRLPVHKLVELCRELAYPIVLLGDRNDFEIGETIRQTDAIRIYNACGKFSLHESADLIRRSKLLIAHDTGLMHIGAALKKVVISIWGSTTPSLGMTPYYGSRFLERKPDAWESVQVKKLWCRPCSEAGLDHCPQGHFKCMKKIDISEIITSVTGRLRL